MELPNELKQLYRHWPCHLISSTSKPTEIFRDPTLKKAILKFISERLSIWKKKYSGENPPYTKDSILSQYRFCNILREFDRQTIEFHKLLLPMRDDFLLWLLNMFYCRMVARPQTIRNIGFLSFSELKNKKLYEKFVQLPRPRFGTPYVFPISVIQKSSTATRELFIADYLPSIIHKMAATIQTWKKRSVYEGVEELLPIFGYNLRFLWTEVLIDVAYQYPEYINLFERFPIGPGSLPTLQRIDKSKDPTILVQALSDLDIDIGLTYENKPIRLSAENWEGVGCEFRKYTNLSEGKGRRRIFRNS